MARNCGVDVVCVSINFRVASLHCAAKHDRTDALKILLEAGASLEAEDEHWFCYCV